MKKMFISVVALAMSVMATATETAYVQIKLTGENGGTSNVYLTEDDAYTNAFEPGVDVEKMMSQSNSKSVLLYGFVGTTPCEDIVAANLDGLKIGFTTNQVDENYTLTFIDVTGRPLRLYDRVTKTETIIVGNGTYDFSVEDFTYERVAFNERFVINRQAYNVTLNDNFLATFSADENVIIPEGLSAYAAKYESEMELLTLYEISDYIPANTGVILYNPNGGVGSNYQKNFSLEIYDGTVPAYTGINDLKPASAYATNHTGHIYVLHGDMMYTYEDEASGMKPNKAFLQIDAQYPAPQRIAFRFSEEQGVENIAAEGKAVKFVENGRVFIKRGEKVYNLQGQLVK